MHNEPRASRPAPPVVLPVEIDGVRYDQDNYASRAEGDQPGGYLVAVDAATGERLWRLKVYEIADLAAMPGGEGLPDFPRMFRSMREADGGQALEIEDESGYGYWVDLETRTVRETGGPG